jgi:hypothetical protein
VTLSGKLIKKDVTDVASGPTKVPFLVLDKPIDVAPGTAGINDANPAMNQTELQVGFNDYKNAMAMVGTHVTVTGELTPQLTGHHFSPVVLVLADLAP